jgi:3-carboxy-cis,cis-muconate cycloisomerase
MDSKIELDPEHSNRSNLLDWMYTEPKTGMIFSMNHLWDCWTKVEIALATAQYRNGLLSEDTLLQISKLASTPFPGNDIRVAVVNVGYPIMELVSYFNSLLPEEHRGFMHLGATTQDIMDSALSLQLLEASKVISDKLILVGNEFARLAQEHAQTVMPARTHGQVAVPTTFGLKCAIYLAELTRHRKRMNRASQEAGQISLYGAGGTSAALGESSWKIRSNMSQQLGLKNTDSPWHVSRDSITELMSACAMIMTSLVRFGREVVDLSRSEIGEIFEPGGHHKGASSTMPQKRNPVLAEAIIGVALNGISNAQQMSRASEAGHERAAGEWQLEWKVIPEVMIATATSLELTSQLVAGLIVNKDRMRRNIDLDNGSIMAEAYMIKLANTMGREAAHNLVYEATRKAKRENLSLNDAIRDLDANAPYEVKPWPLMVENYIGTSVETCRIALRNWLQDNIPSVGA